MFRHRRPPRDCRCAGAGSDRTVAGCGGGRGRGKLNPPPDSARVALLNGFGRSLGDSIVGLQALAAALELGALPGPPVLFRLPGLSPVVQGAYAAAADFCDIRTLPWDAATPGRPFGPAAGFARVIDMRDFAFDPAFRGVAMIDYFLAHLGLAPSDVPPALRRNAWLAPRVSIMPPADLPRDYVLVCPRSSMALRTMPDWLHRAVVARLLAAGRAVVTQGDVPDHLRDNVTEAADAADFAGVCALVGGACAVVSADTAMPHLADAFAVPCLSIFVTHCPEWRVRDYPLNHAVYRPAFGLPAALEFSRGPADEQAAQAAWGAADTEPAWLAAALDHWPALKFSSG